jgi:hypothetical protein
MMTPSGEIINVGDKFMFVTDRNEMTGRIFAEVVGWGGLNDDCAVIRRFDDFTCSAFGMNEISFISANTWEVL